MPKTSAAILVVISLALLSLLGCGSGGRQLKSITTNATGMIQFQVTATGTFNGSPTTVNPLPLSWWVQTGTIVEPPYNYSLSSQPFTVGCGMFPVVAIAPTDPNAPSSGTIPTQVFQDLMNGQVTSEGGFIVSARQTIFCP